MPALSACGDFRVQIEIVPVVILVLMAQDADDVPDAARAGGNVSERRNLQFRAGLVSSPDDFALLGFDVAEHDFHGLQLGRVRQVGPSAALHSSAEGS